MEKTDMVKQLELPIPRARVRLEDARTPRARVRLEDAGRRTLESDMAAVAEVAGRTLEAFGPTYPDAHLSRTSWSTGIPACDGYWEVTDHKTGTMLERWWFARVNGGYVWSQPDGPTNRFSRVARYYMHDEFMAKYAWRGLVQPHPDVYPTPPYSAEELMMRAMAHHVRLSTTYMRMSDGTGLPVRTAENRGRVRL